MRKGYTQFTIEDFEKHPVWKLQGSLTTAEPYKGELPFPENRSRAFFVRTKFKLADKTKMMGWSMICVPPYEMISLNPTILTEAGRVDLTKVTKRPKQQDVENACKILGKRPDQIFPLHFETDAPIPDGPATGKMEGFLHRLSFLDDIGWSKHVDFFYQSAAELETAIKKFQDSESTRKAALEPSDDEKALLKASKTGRVKKVTELIAKGINVNRGGVFEDGGYTRKKVTSLMLAAEAGHVQVVQTLLTAGADIHLTEETNEPRKGLRTALACACRNDHVETARLLLEAGANPNHKLSFQQTILDEVCYEGSIEMIKLLLKFGADPNASCGKSDYFALGRAQAARRIDLIKILIDAKADINGFDDDGATALIRAAKLLRPEIVEFLLEHGANVAHKANGRWTALHRVLCRSDEMDPENNSNVKKEFASLMEIVKSVVKHGADVNAETKYGDTPLSLAKSCKFPELTDYLVRSGAKK